MGVGVQYLGVWDEGITVRAAPPSHPQRAQDCLIKAYSLHHIGILNMI